MDDESTPFDERQLAADLFNGVWACWRRRTAPRTTPTACST
jgi:hypothetical protein